jgi:hypothetical protein
MQPADHIKRWFKDAGLTVRPDADERVFRDVAEAQDSARDNAPASPALWRMTMRNPMTKWAVAAAVIVACLVVLPFRKGTGSGVALADVLTRLGQVTAYVYQMRSTVTSQVGGQTVNSETESTILSSHEYGEKMTMEMRVAGSGQATRSEMYMLPQKKVWYTVMPDQKKYMRLDYDESMMQRQQKQNNDPRALVEMILRCKYRSLGRSVVDGVEVEGFETTDPNYLSGMFGQADVKMWVDVKTQLPVRSEQDVVTDQMKMRLVSYRFQWNVPASEADFEPALSADYTEMAGGPIKLPAINEESAIAGLRLYADLTGRYPEKLDMMGIMSQIGKITAFDAPTAAARRLGEELRSAKTDDERSRKLIDVMLPIQMVSSFHMTLVGGKKEPVYHGEAVTPRDTDKVLLRWKASDTEYRVIFGDLHAETVSAERLAELEK